MLNTKRTCRGRSGGLPPRGMQRMSAVTGLLGLLLLTGCQPHQQTLTIGDLASRYNTAMWELSIVAIVLSIIIFLGVSALLFYTVFRFREENNKKEAEQFHGNDKLEVVLVGFPVVIVLLLSVLTVRTMAQTTPVVEKQVGASITALAKQFWWNFTYTDNESAAGGPVANGNEMVMPAGSNGNVPIDTKLTLQAADVVHEFWAPNIGPQRQAIPGSEKVWTVHTDRPAIYQGNCNYLCGASHANMRFKVIALAPADYETFISAAQNYAAPTPAPGSAEERGYNIFMNGKPETAAVACAACHRVQGTQANSPVGPDLSFFGTRRTLGAGMWQAPVEQGWDDPQAAEHLTNWIKHSPKVKPGSLMPTYDGSEYQVNGQWQKGGVLTDEEISDVAAYLKSLQLPEEANYWQKAQVFNEPAILPGGQQ